MADLEDFENRLKAISRTDWERLFDLIPEIENSRSFGDVEGGKEIEEGVLTMPFMNPAQIVFDFFQIIHELSIVPVFDWVNWTEGCDLISNEQADFSKLPLIDQCKLLTVMIRIDRFCEGFFVSCFENGIVLKILLGMKENIYNRNPIQRSENLS